jgi:hypothetical protein
MMNWSILSMVTQKQLDGLTDVVIQANWMCNDDNNIVRNSASVTFNPPQATFTPYDQLTQAQVLQWVFDALGADQVAAIESELQTQLDIVQNPPVVMLPNPWQ